MSALLSIVCVLVVVGLLLWALAQFPIDETIAKIIRVIVIVAAVLYALHVLLALTGHSGALHA